VPQTQWDTTLVRVAMTPADKIISAQPGEEALSILERMERHSINQIPVIREGVVIGIVVREDLLRFIRLRSELRI
jgi:predicted transcriptional regulator